MSSSPVKTHSELSPSSTSRWWNCPGSVVACRNMPNTTSEYAAEGIAAHAVLERCLKDTRLTPYDLVDMEAEGYTITEEMAEAVAVAVDYIRMEAHKGGSVWVETKIVVVPGEIEGTLDVAIIRPFDTAIIFDYKHGKGVKVRAADNPQLLNYALGVSKLCEVEKFKLVICQPRCEDGANPIDEWECDNEYLSTFENELIRHIALTKEENPLTTAGDWCKFCRAKAVCSTLRGDLVQGMPAVRNRELIFPDAKVLEIGAVVKVLEYKNKIEDWMEAVQSYALSILEAGGEVPGYKLAKKRSNRRWIDETKVVGIFQAELGEKLFNVKVISPAQLEKLIGKDRAKDIDSLSEKPDTGNTIKKQSAKKED